MTKANKDMTPDEFLFSTTIKHAIVDLNYIQEHVLELKDVAPQGVSKGSLTLVESRIYDLKAALYNALKTV